jgi:putative addiction module component (TIGR02574 family)
MDLQTILAEVATWPVESRMQLVERIWDGLVDDGAGPALTEDVRDLLDARIALHEANPDDVLNWDQVVAHVRRPR